MSDGPYKSLPMEPRWKKLAKHASLDACPDEEVSEFLEAALIGDFHDECNPNFLADFRTALEGPAQAALFDSDPTKRLEDLRQLSGGSPLRSLMIDFAILATIRSEDFKEALRQSALEQGIRRCRQVYEHYLREAKHGETRFINQRLNNAMSRLDIEKLVGLITGNSKRTIRQLTPRHTGIDDGVPL